MTDKKLNSLPSTANIKLDTENRFKDTSKEIWIQIQKQQESKSQSYLIRSSTINYSSNGNNPVLITKQDELYKKHSKICILM